MSNRVRDCTPILKKCQQCEIYDQTDYDQGGAQIHWNGRVLQEIYRAIRGHLRAFACISQQQVERSDTPAGLD